MTDPGPRVLCIGASHWDVIGQTKTRLTIGDDVAGRIERRLGGVALNVALGLARHGHPVSLLSCVGNDAAGHALINELEATGVDGAHMLRIDGGATGHYIAIEDDRGDLFAAIADAAVLEENSDAIVRQAGRALQSASTVFLEANLATSALEQIAIASRTAGAEIVANPVSPAKAKRLAFLLSGGFSPIFVANLAEANVLLEGSFETTLEAAKALRSQSSGTALVTDGPRPVTLATPGEIITMSTPVLPDTVSVTGAGDALLSAFLASQNRQDRPKAALQFALDAAAEHMKVSNKI